MIVPKITYKLFFNHLTYKYDILRTKNIIIVFKKKKSESESNTNMIFHNHNFIQIRLLVSFKIEIKIKIIKTHSRPNVYKYMVLYDFHLPSMKEEQLRKKIKLCPLSDILI